MSDNEKFAANRLRAAVLQCVLEARGVAPKLEENEWPQLKGRMQEIYNQKREAAANAGPKPHLPSPRSLRVIAHLYLIWALLFLVLAQLSQQTVTY
jgi:hypothetical protein